MVFLDSLEDGFDRVVVRKGEGAEDMLGLGMRSSSHCKSRCQLAKTCGSYFDQRGAL